MPTVLVNDVVDKAQTVLQDATGVRWPRPELVGWLNDAYREIVAIRPDANSQTGTFTCAAGTRQTLTVGFPNAIKLLDVVRNVATGSAKGAVRQVARAILDDQLPGWHAETPAIDIEHFVFDPRLPTGFLVYPPAVTTAQLEVVFYSVPLPHVPASVGALETINVDDSYANAILDYVLYRAYSKDAEYAGNANRAAAHYAAMTASIGAKTATDSASNPA